MKIQKNELSSVLITLLCMKLFLTYPRRMLSFAGNAAWIVSIYITLIALFVFFITEKIYRTNKSVITIAEEVGGRGLKIITGIITFILLLSNVCITFRIFPESVHMILLQNTPMIAIIIILIIGVALGSRNGIESLARITSFFLPVAAIVMIGFILLLYPHFMFKNILPIFGTGANKIFIDGTQGISMFSDIIALNILLPLAPNRKAAAKAGYKAIIISGIAMTVLLITLGLVYPYPVSNQFQTPVYQLTRLVSIGNFFSRVEAFFEFIWSIAMFLYAGIYITLLCHILKETFGLKYYKPLILPVLTICAGLAYIPDSIIEFISTYEKYIIYFYIAQAGVPIIFGTLERIRNHKEEA